MSENKDTNSIKVKVQNNAGSVIWAIGFLFTVGYIGFPTGGSVWSQIVDLSLTFLLWPFALGLTLRGR